MSRKEIVWNGQSMHLRSVVLGHNEKVKLRQDMMIYSRIRSTSKVLILIILIGHVRKERFRK